MSRVLRVSRVKCSAARRGTSLDWLVELEREEDGEREDKCGAAAFGVFIGRVHRAHRLQSLSGGLGERGTSGTR